MAAFATSLHVRPARNAWARLRRATIFALIAALHAGLLLVASRWQARLDVRSEESLVLLALPAHMQSTEEARPPPNAPRKLPPPARDMQLVIVPTPVEPPPAEQHPAIVDWKAEAELTARQQAQAAGAPPPRALDKQLAGMYVGGGALGSDPGNAPEFGWDHARTHRVETIEGGGSMLWISDRCFLVMYGVIPFPMCGVGKIPVRGDLFDHMRDAQAQASSANN